MEIFPEKNVISEILGRENFFPSPQIRRQVSATGLLKLFLGGKTCSGCPLKVCTHVPHCQHLILAFDDVSGDAKVYYDFWLTFP